MKFMYPLGLLGLIGIPVLIIIYLIKNKYTEQTVSSTYLWTLSERFLKRKKRVHPIAGLISLILQILAVASISMAIAHPIMVLPDQAKEVCFILDASASMNMQKDGVTRLERGKDFIEEKINSSVDGSVYSLLCVSDVTEIVYEKSRDKDEARGLLDKAQPGYVETDFSGAIALAQNYFTANPGVKVYLITDQHYEISENIEIVNVSAGEINYAVSPLEAETSGSKVTVTGSVSSFETVGNTDLSVELLLNGSTTVVATQSVAVSDEEAGLFTLVAENVDVFESVRVRLANHSDALASDDESILYNVENENAYDTLVVSDNPYMISSAIEAAGSANVTIMSTEEYDGRFGYGLYVFDGYAPATLPTDGTIWFINLQESVSGTGFSFQGEEEVPEGETLSLTKSSSSLAQRLTQGIEGKNIYISKYLRYGRSSQFTTLMSYKNNPVVFTGVTANENREVVFAFDIHTTDLPMQIDFLVLIRNLLNYSFPPVLEEVSYYSGDTLEVNLQTNMEAVRVEAPSGTHVYLTMAGVIAEYTLDEVGIHKIIVTYSEAGSQRSFYVYAGVPEAERNPYASAQYVGLQGEATNGGLEGSYDPLKVIFIILAVVFLADWAVYCYEKYQLR